VRAFDVPNVLAAFLDGKYGRVLVHLISDAERG
jgi:hypothetical protein